MPANYHHIHIAGSGPQLQIVSVGVRTVLKLQIFMAHLWESIVKRKILSETSSGEQERHIQILKKMSHFSDSKINRSVSLSHPYSVSSASTVLIDSNIDANLVTKIFL